AVLLLTGGSGPGVAAPSLIGQTQKSALAKAADAGVLVQVTGQRRADDPRGLILDQSPAPGAFVSRGGQIDVVVSLGPPPVPVPSVVGRTLTDAQTILTQAGFQVNVEQRYDNTIPKGVVLSTSPAGASKAPPESTVNVVVSQGPAPIPIPDVSNQPYAAAAQTLSGKGFDPVAQNAYSDTVPVGQVIGTDPPAGTAVVPGTQITVNVSQGPQPVTVPNVVGESVESASQQLTALGLVPDVQNYGPGKPVKSTSPAAGAMVKKGSTVTLVL
ncbi:MAG TPA: PASTA domain-containing protein, partial [Acidimicrobiia bacterium]|nr:PASTA domain-containing protein [Acidimicrobiia bacterium]